MFFSKIFWIKILINRNWREGNLGIVIVETGDLDMPIKGGNLFANLVFKTNARSNGNEHHHHPDRNGGDGDFYYRGGNTNFMFLPCNKAFGNK